MPSNQPMAATAAMRPGNVGMQGHDAMAANAGYNPNAYPQPMGTPPGPQAAMAPHMAHGTPGAMEQQHPGHGLAPHEGHQQPQRTVLGVQAPPGLGNYGGQMRPSGQHAAQQSGGMMPMQNPQLVQQNQSYPGYAQPGYPQGYPQQHGYPPQYGSYPSGQMPMMGATPLDQAGMPIEGKRSTLVRDIGIGVGIAALVLVGFLVVKMVILDNDTKPGSGSAQQTSKFATVKLSMPTGVAAEMFVDGERIATVTSDSPGIPVSAGVKHIKLVGTNGLSCDDPKVKLEAGKTTTLECNFGMTGSGSAGSAAAATGSAGSATQVAQAGTGSGSADAKATDAKATDPKATDPKKPGDAKTVEKAPDTKTDTKKTDTKKSGVTDTKATDTKASDTKKTGDTHTTETKPPVDTKATGGDPNKGYLQVFSKPPAKIFVDGTDTGLKTPISGQSLQLAPGKHKITFAIGDDRFTYPVQIKAGVTETMSKDLQ